MFDRLPLLALFALSLGCSLPLDAADEAAGNVEPKARHSFPSDGPYDTNFFAIECMAGSSAGTASSGGSRASNFMTKFSDALADAGIDHRLEEDGSISYRSEDEDAVSSIGDDFFYAPVVDELQRSEDLGCKDGAKSGD
jgi:hypothetical protein